MKKLSSCKSPTIRQIDKLSEFLLAASDKHCSSSACCWEKISPLNYHFRTNSADGQNPHDLIVLSVVFEMTARLMNMLAGCIAQTCYFYDGCKHNALNRITSTRRIVVSRWLQLQMVVCLVTLYVAEEGILPAQQLLLLAF